MERLPLTAFKIPHHGGRSNLSVALLNEIACQHYLISTNGKMFQHPHPKTLGRIIVHGGAGSRLCFNYTSDYNMRCNHDELHQQFGYTTTYPEADNEGLRLRL